MKHRVTGEESPSPVASTALARTENSAQRFYSMSSQIREERKGYYEILEATQKHGLDVTVWLVWFVDCFGRAIGKATELTSSVLAKEGFGRDLKQRSIDVSERSEKKLNGFWRDLKGNSRRKTGRSLPRVRMTPRSATYRI